LLHLAPVVILAITILAIAILAISMIVIASIATTSSILANAMIATAILAIAIPAIHLLPTTTNITHIHIVSSIHIHPYIKTTTGLQRPSRRRPKN
jgi:hypothetical protein